MTDPDPNDLPADAQGKLEQRLAMMEPASPPELAGEKIELAERSPRAVRARAENDRAQLRARSSRPWALKLVIFALLLGVAGLAALLHFKPKLQLPSSDGVREATLLDALGSGERPPLLISSTPAGATILIGGKAIGETPWAGENLWRGETALVLQLPGYRPWEGKLKGGQPQTLDIRLRK